MDANSLDSRQYPEILSLSTCQLSATQPPDAIFTHADLVSGSSALTWFSLYFHLYLFIYLYLTQSSM